MEEPRVTNGLGNQMKILGAALLAMWVFFIVSWLTGGLVLALGVIPRTTIGLRGILFAPVLHGSLAHILANSIPFAILGWMVMLRDARHFVTVLSLRCCLPD